MTKVIASAACVALKEALSTVYWYKSGLRSFLTSTIANPALLAPLNWADYKRNIVAQLVDYMAKRQDQYQGELIRLMSEVSQIDDFPISKDLRVEKKRRLRREELSAHCASTRRGTKLWSILSGRSSSVDSKPMHDCCGGQPYVKVLSN